MDFLIAAPQGEIFERHFPPALLARLGKIGEVRLNPHTRQMTREELKAALKDCDAVLTHWGSTQYDGEMLDAAPRLRILAHCAGTVACIASEECYRRGVHVLSANSIMAGYVAEGVLGMMLAALRELPRCDQAMKQGKWERRVAQSRTLFGAEIGMIGLGSVGKRLLELLAPFGCRVRVYDPYCAPGKLAAFPMAHRASFEEALSCPIVTLHAAQTPETFHMIDAKALSRIPDDGLLINSARGSLVDTGALIAELSNGRIRAALDVFEQENQAQSPEMRACANALLIPHMAAAPAQSVMTEGIILAIEDLLAGRETALEVPYSQFRHMTRE